MASIYSENHRGLQREFGTTRLAEMLDRDWVHDRLADEEKAFIGSRDMFFLSTVDPDGNPTVSYKGGPSGFVRVLDDSTLVFPGYDGNGMFYSVGNIVGQTRVGMLFIDFENPHRLRLQGTAELLRDDPLLADYTEAKYLVRVTVTKVWVNCPRYIHRYRKIGQSKYVPQAACETPLASWKRLDMVQDVLPEHEKRQAEQEGLLTLPEYERKVAGGDA
jgi:uncharacterized protein